MKTRLAARGIELSKDLERYIRRRIHFSLGRFAGKIRFLAISLADVNGPRGGIDKACDIRIHVGPQQVIVRERQTGIHAAIAFAMERAERAIRRRLKLRTRRDRGGRGPSPELGIAA